MTTPLEPDVPCRTFPKEMRLRASGDFQRVYHNKRSVSDDHLILYAAKNELPHPRFGASVSKKVGNAVRRNRWKRLLREAFRLTRHALPTGLDYVAIPRLPETPHVETLCESLYHLARRVEKRARS